MSNENAVVCFWDFPYEEFQRLRTFTDNEEFANMHDYQDMLFSLISSFEAAGEEVIKVRMTVDEMASRLEAAGFENTTENRAAILTMEVKPNDDKETTK